MRITNVSLELEQYYILRLFSSNIHGTKINKRKRRDANADLGKILVTFTRLFSTNEIAAIAQIGKARIVRNYER